MKAIGYAVLGGWLAAGVAGTTCAVELARATPKDAGFSAAKLQRVKAVVQEMVDKEQVAGAVVVVARHGKVVLMEAVGKSDVAAGTPMRPDAIFRIYSMTKPVTTAAAMTLYDEGKFGLDDPVSKYLLEFKGLRVLSGKGEETITAKREVTIRDLMRHTSGLIYEGMRPGTTLDRLYRAAGVEDGRGSLADMVQKLGKLPLQCQPGTRFNYGVSTDVLGRVCEVVSGKPLDEFFRQRVLGPLDMKDTGFFVPADKLDRFTASHGPGQKGGLRVVDKPATSRFRSRPTYLSGGGGLVSTARDYLRFCQMMLNGGRLDGVRVLRPETVRLMTTNQLPDEAMPMNLAGMPVPGMGFGLGFSVRTGGGVSAGEYGWSGFASTHFWVAPRPDLVVIALQQYTPFTRRLEAALKPVVYAALED
jgi:CubicO group peptidase (beta-lactamase class C family)